MSIRLPIQSSTSITGSCKISTFGPSIVSESNHYQIPANSTMVPQNGHRPSQEARYRELMNPTRKKAVNTQTDIYSSAQLTLSKKSNSIEICFKEQNLSGTIDQSISFTLRDFHICVNHHGLSNDERSQFVIKFPKAGALEFYPRKRSTWKCLIKLFFISYVEDTTHIYKFIPSIRSQLSEVLRTQGPSSDTIWGRKYKSYDWIAQQYYTIIRGWSPCSVK